MISKGDFISELKQGDSLKGVFIVSERRLLKTRDGRQYARLQLVDKTGDMTAMIWDDVKQQLIDIDAGSVVGVRGSVESYENKLQMRIDKIVRLNEKEVDMTNLVPSTSRDIQAMKTELDTIISSIKDRFLSTLVKNILERQEMKEGFLKAPAAKSIHHNYVGGLLEHTIQLARSVLALFPVYSSMGMNQDLILAGAILHDVGKVNEYSYDKFIDITPVGRLVGHVYLSTRIVDEEIVKIDGFPEELKIQIIHLILSHHGQLEFGSPKLPMTKEAIFLHMVDDLDAKLTGFASIIEATPEEELFSAFSHVYNRYLYTKMYPEEG
jgi:3'-5' exoribonuclease